MNERDLPFRPYFVYGTLRPGVGNDRLWHGLADPVGDGEVTASGFIMVASGIPWAIHTGRDLDKIVGCLIVPRPDDWDSAAELRRRLDGLEGHPFSYERMPTPVLVDRRKIWAWIYSPTHREIDAPTVPSGDFIDHRILREERYAHHHR